MRPHSTWCQNCSVRVRFHRDTAASGNLKHLIDVLGLFTLSLELATRSVLARLPGTTVASKGFTNHEHFWIREHEPWRE